MDDSHVLESEIPFHRSQLHLIDGRDLGQRRVSDILWGFRFALSFGYTLDIMDTFDITNESVTLVVVLPLSPSDLPRLFLHQCGCATDQNSACYNFKCLCE